MNGVSREKSSKHLEQLSGKSGNQRWKELYDWEGTCPPQISMQWGKTRPVPPRGTGLVLIQIILGLSDTKAEIFVDWCCLRRLYTTPQRCTRT